MASIHKEIVVDVPAQAAWDAIGDVGRIHLRLARDFVLDTTLDGDSRLVRFANGTVVRERIVDIDDAARRLAYSIVEWKATHHHATFQVFPESAQRSRIVWVADLLPNELADPVAQMMEQGCQAMKRTLEASVAEQANAER